MLSNSVFYCAFHSIVVILQKILKQSYHEKVTYYRIVCTGYVQCIGVRNGARSKNQATRFKDKGIGSKIINYFVYFFLVNICHTS